MNRRETWSTKRLHLVGAAAVVVLVAGAAGSYVGLTSASTRSPSTDPQSGRTDVARISAEASTPGAGGPATGLAGSGDIACPMIPAPTGTTSGSDGVGGATHVFTRTTASGVTIRAYRLPATGTCGCGPILDAPGNPSASATTTALVAEGPVSVELSDDTAVGVGTLFDASGPEATTANASTDPGASASGAFGVAEGAPVWWTAVSVGMDVATAEMTFADGSSDQMAPVDGLVVLAHPIDPSTASSGQGPYVVRGTLRLLDASGAVLTTVAFPEPVPSPVPPPVTVPGSPPVIMSGSANTTSVVPPPTPSGTGSAIAVCPDVAASVPPLKAVTSPTS